MNSLHLALAIYPHFCISTKDYPTKTIFKEKYFKDVSIHSLRQPQNVQNPPFHQTLNTYVAQN